MVFARAGVSIHRFQRKNIFHRFQHFIYIGLFWNFLTCNFHVKSLTNWSFLWLKWNFPRKWRSVGTSTSFPEQRMASLSVLASTQKPVYWKTSTTIQLLWTGNKKLLGKKTTRLVLKTRVPSLPIINKSYSYSLSKGKQVLLHASFANVTNDWVFCDYDTTIQLY